MAPRTPESCRKLAAMVGRECAVSTLQCRKRATTQTRMLTPFCKSNSALRAWTPSLCVGAALRDFLNVLAQAHMHASLLLRRRYFGLTGTADLPAEHQRKDHHSMARFEWTLTSHETEKKEEVQVVNNNVKRRGVPLPEAWLQTTASDLQKECEKAAAKLMAVLMVETRERGAMITCQPRP